MFNDVTQLCFLSTILCGTNNESQIFSIKRKNEDLGYELVLDKLICCCYFTF